MWKVKAFTKPDRPFYLSAGILCNVPKVLKGTRANNFGSNSIIKQIGVWTIVILSEKQCLEVHTQTCPWPGFEDKPKLEFLWCITQTVMSLNHKWIGGSKWMNNHNHRKGKPKYLLYLHHIWIQCAIFEKMSGSN